MTINEAIDGWTGFLYPRRRTRWYFFGCFPLVFVFMLLIVLKAALWVVGMFLIGVWFGFAWFFTTIANLIIR